jgi:hypothetical protein
MIRFLLTVVSVGLFSVLSLATINSQDLRNTTWISANPRVAAALTIGDDLRWHVQIPNDEGDIQEGMGESIFTTEGFDNRGSLIVLVKDGQAVLAFGTNDDQLNINTTELMYDDIVLRAQH